ncbi:outer membrane lipase/esterase [Rhizobiales bacterium GAS113]|nr:outer membrane lipase/esterase [Rhizobiales bacterium GAS113]
MALSFVPMAAKAQSFTRLVSFGDSLTDNGNLFAKFGVPMSPPYNMRFTNGLTFAEYLSGQMAPFGALGPGSVNYAFGGARTDSLSVTPNLGIPGIQDQVNTFLGSGGVFGPRDVVSLWGGANNIFLANPPSDPAAAQAVMAGVATSAASDIGKELQQIAAAGARTILVYSLPNFGVLPQYTALGPAAVQLAQFSSTTFNLAWNTAVRSAAAANPGTNIIQVDIGAAFTAVLANPAAFRLGNVTGQCVLTPSCVNSSFANQNLFLFWDEVHPTSTGQQLVAALTRTYLYAPQMTSTVPMLSEVGFWSRRAGMVDGLDRIRAYAPTPDKTDFFVAAVGDHGERDANIVTQQFIGGPLSAQSQQFYDYSLGGLRFGALHGFGNGFSGGLALSALTGDAKAGLISASPTALGVDLIGGWRGGPWFANATFGAAYDRYDSYERKTLIAALTEKGSADGYSLNSALEAGYDYRIGQMVFTPLARLSYIRSNVQSFNESGLAAMVAFGHQNLGALAGGGELRARFQLTDTAAVSALVGYENFLTHSAGHLQGRLINNTALPFSIAAPAPVGAGLQVGAGLEGAYNGWTFGASYRGSFGTKNQMQHIAQLTVGTKW